MLKKISSLLITLFLFTAARACASINIPDEVLSGLTNAATSALNDYLGNKTDNGGSSTTSDNSGSEISTNSSTVPKARKSWTIKFEKLPQNLRELKALPQGSLKKPQHTAALTIVALAVYTRDTKAGLEMLEYLNGPNDLSDYDKKFIAERLDEREYLPFSYFLGATVENNYTPDSQPYSIRVKEMPSSNEMEEGYMKLFLTSAGADSPRPVTLRKKPSTGQWFLWKHSLLLGIREPASKDPWS